MSIINLEEITQIKPIECPNRGGINFPCVICKECDIGIASITLEDNYIVESTVNSVLIHMMLNMKENDPVEKAALKMLKGQLSKLIPPIQRGDWDEGDLSILITTELIDDKDLLNNIDHFVKGFPTIWRKLAVEAKRALTKWSETNANSIAHQFFRELRKA